MLIIKGLSATYKAYDLSEMLAKEVYIYYYKSSAILFNIGHGSG